MAKFEAGKPRNEKAGRKKGTPNKRTVEEREAYEAIMELIEQRMLDGDDVINNLSAARAAELYVNLVAFKKAKLSATRIDADVKQDSKIEFVVKYHNGLDKGKSDADS